MIKVKYLILGAGPAGLTFANKLLEAGEKDFLVLERNSEAGGLCRSSDVDGRPLDIGGGHFLDVRRKDVCDFLFGFMPESEWDIYVRDSRIDMGSYTIANPIEANIWQMPDSVQKEYLETIAAAGCNTGAPQPERFTEWITWKLGSRICEDYMLPYNRKMFGDDLDLLGTYWLEKLPNVSYEDTLASCRDHRAYGSQPGHAGFYYPKKYGYGEVWLRMADALGERIVYDTPAVSFDMDLRTVNGEFSADCIITTVPWKSFKTITGLDSALMDDIDSLRYTSVVIDYVPKHIDTPAHWIYYPNPELSYHRILVRHNFCPDSRGYWTETNLDRFDLASESTYFINDYAYPLNTIGKPESMDRLLTYAQTRNIYGLGRWGEWQHYNSDVVVSRAMELCDRLIREN